MQDDIIVPGISRAKGRQNMTSCMQCGAPLDTVAPEGLCSRCLLSVAMKTQDPAPADSGADKRWSPESTVAAGNQIGPIRLIRQIGKGGMGEVWSGWHEFLGRNVAVKFLTRQAMDRHDPAFTMFMQGARIAASIEHSGLNKIHHADVADGVPYLVLELLDGPNLGDLVERSGPLDLSTARAVLEAVGEAVAELNQKDLVHRDIKPSNIVLTTDGRVVLTDFGLACARPPANADGGQGLAGTPAYMAPEMFNGVVSTKTDVYALGMTAYHILGGRPAFAGNLEEQRRQHRETALDIEPLCAAGVPQGVIDVVLRATSKDALFRPKTAWQILVALRAAFDAAEVKSADREKLSRTLRNRTGSSSERVCAVASPSPGGGIAETIAELAARKRESRGAIKPIAALPLPPLPKIATNAIIPPPPSSVSQPSALPISAGRTPEPRPAAPSPILFCGKCRYCIQGLSASICPECGSDLTIVGTAVLSPRRYWKLAAQVSVWTLTSYIAFMLLFMAVYKWAIPYTHHRHLHRVIMPGGPNAGGILTIDAEGRKIVWGRRADFQPAITDISLTYVNAGKRLKMDVNPQTGGYGYTDADGKVIAAPSGFDVNVLLGWLSNAGWKPEDRIDRILADSMMSCIAPMSVSRPEAGFSTFPAEGTNYRLQAFPIEDFVHDTAPDPEGMKSYGDPPNWIWRITRRPVWFVVWLVGIVWLVRRQGWRFTRLRV